MDKIWLQPTAEDSFRIVYGDDSAPFFQQAFEESQRQEAAGDIEGACNTRYAAFQRLVELIPDDTETVLEWDDRHNQNALVLVNSSAIDHFLVGDFEMCAGMLEMMLELDPEDHLEVTARLAYSYLALEEYELFDEVINDISDKYAEKEILKLWSEFRRTGKISEGELRHFRKNFVVYHREFISPDHPVTEHYLNDIARERPGNDTLARELWLQTEHLWTLFPGFIEALRKWKSC